MDHHPHLCKGLSHAGAFRIRKVSPYQELSALTPVRSSQADVAKELAAIDGDRSLPTIEQDALQHGRPILAQIDITHRVQDVGVWRPDESFGVESLLPDRQNLVAGAEGLSDPTCMPSVLINGIAQPALRFPLANRAANPSR